jgi:glycosyltransferase involved in cell wall biosynthesis
LWGLAASRPDAKFDWCYRPHKILKSLRDRLPGNASRRFLRYSAAPPKADLFHALNQRVEFPVKTCPIVTTFHDLFVMTGDYSTAEFRARFADQARRAAERSDLIIAVSEFTANQVRDLLQPAVPVHVVHHGVYLPPSPPPGEADRQNIVLHVGAIQKRKNIVRLIDAFATLPKDWRLVLAGSARGFAGEEAVAHAKASKAADRIEIAGYVEVERLDELYRTARILAFPSLDEGFGIPVIEAMALGLPVVTSDGSALKEAAGDAAVLVDPQRTESIAEALRTLASAPGLRNQLRDMGWKRAQQFTWSRAVQSTWDCYGSV